MNRLNGIISSVKSNGQLYLVKIEVNNSIMTSIVIGSSDIVPILKKGRRIDVIFKETEVIIGKGWDHSISLQNRLHGSISHIDTGSFLAKVTIDTDAGSVVSIITQAAVNQMELKEGMKVSAMIKTNEVMLAG